jgi:hypothetical protein
MSLIRALILAVGVAPLGNTRDIDCLLNFITEQTGRSFDVFLFDKRWKGMNQPIISEEKDPETYHRTTLIYEEDIDLPFEGNGETPAQQRERQTKVQEFKTLEAFGKSCPVEERSILKPYKDMSMDYEELYIYNCAWVDTGVAKEEPQLQQNAYFENMCGLANIFADHPNAFLLTNNGNLPVFSDSERITRCMFKTPKPARFRPFYMMSLKIKGNQAIRPAGGRKRTRRGLKKRRATRRWKHRS